MLVATGGRHARLAGIVARPLEVRELDRQEQSVELELPRSGRFVLALLDRRRRWDYLLLAIVGGLPGALAWHFGLHESFEAAGHLWVGFFDKPNMWPQVVLLPLFVFLVRWAVARIADVSAADMPEPAPPIVRLFAEGQDRERAYEALRRAVGSRTTCFVVLALTAFVMILDTAELVAIYRTDDLARVTEFDWSLMYLTGAVERTDNLLMVISAYVLQAVLFLFRFLAISFVLIHNVFFLRHVLQRRRRGDRPGIPVDLDDPERCLGLRGASEAFNTQVILLGLGGSAILLSRFAQFSTDAGIGWANVLAWPPDVRPAVGFPDMGQWILATAWLVAMLVVVLPLATKHLPLFGPRGPELSLAEFLGEFAPDEGLEEASAARVEARARRFARQSFWPAGDNRASVLFFFSAAVLLVVLYPLRIAETSLLIVALGVLAVLAWALGRLAFVVLKLPLAFVDPRLVRVGGGDAEPEDTGPLDLKVFLSYRREDSRAYARLLQKALGEHMRPADIFMDLESLSDGEDFVDRIDTAVRASDAMLVLIGPGWLSAADEAGARRLENADDFVAREVALALEAELLVVPVLVGGAEMPSSSDLPPALEPLWRRQARVLDDGHWDYDVEQLIASLRAST